MTYLVVWFGPTFLLISLGSLHGTNYFRPKSDTGISQSHWKNRWWIINYIHHTRGLRSALYLFKNRCLIWWNFLSLTMSVTLFWLGDFVRAKNDVWFGEIRSQWQIHYILQTFVYSWPPPSHGYAFEPQAQIMPPPNWNDNCSLTPRNSDFVIINFPFAERNRSIQFNQRFH